MELGLIDWVYLKNINYSISCVVQKHENTKTRKHKNTKTQKHKNTKTQKKLTSAPERPTKWTHK